ncbi:MAG: hypothetical protein ACMXX9_04625 [Candidatus Woesearchaeota archaeon]
MHDNWGDFYSDHKVEELSDVIYRSLNKHTDEEYSTNDLLIVNASDFKLQQPDIDKDYIIKENNGVRLFLPAAHDNPPYSLQEVYGFLSLFFVEDLFSDKKKGTFQKECEEFIYKFNQKK